MSGIFYKWNTKPKPPGTAIEPLLEEVRRQYDKTLDIKSSLEGRANNIISVSGTVATLLFGFGTFALQNLNPNFVYMTTFIVLLALGIAASVAAILVLTILFTVRKYGVPISPKTLLEPKNGVRELDSYIQDNKENFCNIMVEQYLENIDMNNTANDIKARLLSYGLWIFFSGMITIPLLLAVILFAVSLKEFSFSLFK